MPRLSRSAGRSAVADHSRDRVEAAAAKICIEGHEGCVAKGEHLRQAQDALAAALPGLQQATPARANPQRDRLLRACAVRDAAEERFYDGDTDQPLEGYIRLMEYADMIEFGRVVARGETPKEDAG